MIRLALLLVLIAASGLSVSSQVLRFEVASIKPNNSGSDNSARNLGANGRLVFENFPLRQLIIAAYDIQAFQLLGGPAWINNERFDVEARAAATTPLPQMYLMLRSLLADRFRLVVRQEKRQLPVYALVKARSDGGLGPRMKASAVDCGPTGRGRGAPAPESPPGPPAGCRALITPSGVSFEGQTTAQLATVLGMALRQTVIDKTGLVGGFDLQLSFSPDSAPAPDPNLPSLFTALQEQLGLKLESTHAPMEVVVIDSVDRPTPD